ncbi:MAG: NADH-quinone oxidoreductase subunit D [Caldilineaceae bacterium]|nr:NADH-quinone oxidoreductase subunit D [Caldilineaceae bacterium]
MSDAIVVTESPDTPAVDSPFAQAVPGAVVGQWAEESERALVVAPDKLVDFLTYLRDQEQYDFLSGVTCVDYSAYKGKLRAGVAERFDVVYHLYSTQKGGGPVVLHVRVPKNETVPSATGVYPGANLQEREVYDLYGITFEGHPNLRRILLWDGFNGHPMRKDWKEAYFEEEFKPFKNRHPNGKYHFQEDRLPWHKNTTYPAGWDPDDWKEPVTYVPVSQAPMDSDGYEMATEDIVVNLGPHHPSTHGVFRMLARLDGETILALEPEMGYLHRNHEQIGERNTWLMNMPYTDRLDYLNSMSNNLGYALAVEKLAGIEVPERANYIRIVMAELTRVLNHMWSVGFILNDLGALQTPALYAIEEREMILDLFEEVSGSRMMCNYMRFGGVVRDLTPGWEDRARYLAHERLPRALDQLDHMLSDNEIVIARGRGVGYLSPQDLIALSVSGPQIRAAGIAYDIRKAEPYCIYDRFEFDIPTLPESDIYARYYIRILEARQSVKILQQALRDMPPGEINAYASTTLSQGFGTIMGGKGGYTLRAPEGEVYQRVEAPKGELGFYLVSDGKTNPYRYHVRAPSYINLNALGPMSVGYKIADAVVILGAIDIVLGEVDR